MPIHEENNLSNDKNKKLTMCTQLDVILKHGWNVMEFCFCPSKTYTFFLEFC